MSGGDIAAIIAAGGFVLLVVFIFNEKWGSIEIAQFMKRFDIYTQRGGG